MILTIRFFFLSSIFCLYSVFGMQENENKPLLEVNYPNVNLKLYVGKTLVNGKKEYTLKVDSEEGTGSSIGDESYLISVLNMGRSGGFDLEGAKAEMLGRWWQYRCSMYKYLR